MPAYYSDDYERITGDAVPEDNHDRLTPDPLKNITADTSAPEPISVTTKVIQPPAVDTK